MAFSLGGAIATPAIQGIMALLTMMGDKKTQGQYTADQRRQIADALRVAGFAGPTTMNAYDQSASQGLGELQGLRESQKKQIEDLMGSATGGYGKAEEEYRKGLGDLLTGYQDRYNAAAQDIAGYGAQQRADIDRGAEEERARFAVNPLSRASTSRTVFKNIEDSRRQNQQRLGEDLTRMRVGLLSGLSGEKLAAQGQGMGALYGNALNTTNVGKDLGMFGVTNDAAMGGNLANWYGSNAINRSNLAGQGINTYLNTLTGVNNVPPPQSNLPFIFGQNSVAAPSSPSFWESAGPGMLQGGMQAGGMMAGASIIATAVICIAGDSKLETPDGPVTLKDIKVGQQVLNSDGEWKKVIAKHHRKYTGGPGLYVRLVIDEAPIVISLDHPIEGRPASDWIEDPLITHWEHAIPASAGDILLEDGSEYIANGYAITSLFDRSCIPLLNALEPENQVMAV